MVRTYCYIGRNSTLTVEQIDKLKTDLIPLHRIFPKWWTDSSIRCTHCRDVFYLKGCPSCGNTFLKREILRQTS